MTAAPGQTRQAAVEQLIARLDLDLRTHANIEVSDRVHTIALTLFGERSHVGREERWAQVLAPS